jgi:predicted amidophosphoribosyltransferase
MESLPHRDREPPLPGVKTQGCPVAWYFRDGPRFFRLLHAVKYGGQYPLMEPLSQFFVRWAAPLLARIESPCIVPLPDDPRRLAERGYSLPEVLARRLAANGNLPLARGILTRRKATRSLATLSRVEEREAALSSVFQVSRLAELPARVPLILVDDQVTTGATLRSCVPLLRSRGHPLLALALAGAAAAPRRV